MPSIDPFQDIDPMLSNDVDQSDDNHHGGQYLAISSPYDVMFSFKNLQKWLDNS